ncbi:glycosyl group 2 family protein [Neofusicoccum parvum]|uniref:Glycosyl group 2 family protein n=1 Tax=Neofusicoccum parvum TaxID=310453 RepID=A0ACB5SCQ0_9PEZI|nr:glycosyl group 2 family protein [Neofusicoccum parvum]
MESNGPSAPGDVAEDVVLQDVVLPARNASFGSSEKPAQNHGKPRPISSVPPDEQVTFAVPDGGQKRISFHPKFNDYSFGASSSITKSTTKDSHRISFREAVQTDGIDQSEKQGPPAMPPTIQQRARNVRNSIRRSSVWDLYQNAKGRGAALQRQRWVQLLFEYTMYTLALALVYFVFVGVPLWKGSVYWLYWVVSHKFVVPWTFSITIGIATVYAFLPLLIFFEKEPPARHGIDIKDIPGVKDTALLIPCYKSASLIANTLDAALKTFPPSHIFVIANGNSQTPLDNTEEVCRPYGVNHVWCPVGSKIVAQFVGSFAAKEFKNVLLIDDDCALPPNFPVVAERLTERVKCIGYTIKAQDLEYKLSGLQRAFAGKVGSATFPHGAISLWDREFFIRTFHDHPGFSVSEDWFFGDSCRSLGGRIIMCTSIFVETETPSAIFWNRKGGSRGGFGEMTVFKQRFMRWNFFFVAGIWYNMAYIFSSWKLGWWEIGAKLFVFQEIPYKCALTFVNVVSCYWSIFKYARYFAKRHLKITEDENAVKVVLRLEETESCSVSHGASFAYEGGGRRMTVVTVTA